jgi:hypothetical protein
MVMSKDKRRQHDTINQDEDSNKATPASQDGGDGEFLSRSTTKTQCTFTTGGVAGAVHPVVTANLAVATSIPVFHRATHSIRLLDSAIKGTTKDDDTVEAILDEAEDNDDSFASGYPKFLLRLMVAPALVARQHVWQSRREVFPPQFEQEASFLVSLLCLYHHPRWLGQQPP